MTESIFNSIDSDPGFVDIPSNHIDIKVIGVGGGGVNAIDRLCALNVTGVSLVAVNTDRASLAASAAPVRLCLGNGKGAGDKPEVARQSAEDSADEIAHLFDDNAKLVFITASMGGGTGTGAAPVVARLAHERQLLTVGVVTIPFHFEGKNKIKKALLGAEEMSHHLDALIVINNQNLIDCYPDNTMRENFALADDTLACAVKSISELVEKRGYWNIDLNDVDTTLRGQGVANISNGVGQGEHRVQQALDEALRSPLLKNRDVYGASRLLIAVFTSPQEQYTLKGHEMQQLRDFKKKFRGEPEQITGWYYDDDLDDQVKVTVLAAGFSMSFNSEMDEPVYTILTPEQMDDEGSIQHIEATPTLNRVREVDKAEKSSKKKIVF